MTGGRQEKLAAASPALIAHAQPSDTPAVGNATSLLMALTRVTRGRTREEFSLERLRTLTQEQMDERYESCRVMSQFGVLG